MTKEKRIIEASDYFRAQALVEDACDVVTDHPNGTHATDYDFAVMVIDKLANWLNAARDQIHTLETQDKEKGNGFTNVETYRAALVFQQLETHQNAAKEAVARICQWDSEEEIIIPKIMEWAKSYFSEIHDMNSAQEYIVTSNPVYYIASRKRANDYKDAVGELFNVATWRVNWRELAESLYESHLQRVSM